VIDLHCHVLPGLDDGPENMDEALELLARQAECGVDAVVATPHVSHNYPGVTAEAIAEGVKELREAAKDARIPVRVIAGAEVALTRAVDLSDRQLAALRLGGGPWLLLEPPYAPMSASALEAAIGGLLRRGHRIVLAPPERCSAFHTDREPLERLIEAGVRCSVTAGALTGAFGRTVRKFALEMLEDGLVHNIASDAHGGMESRPPGLAGPLKEAGYEDLAEWLCHQVPLALLGGTEPPDPPAVHRHKRGLGRGLTRLLGN